MDLKMTPEDARRLLEKEAEEAKARLDRVGRDLLAELEASREARDRVASADPRKTADVEVAMEGKVTYDNPADLLLSVSGMTVGHSRMLTPMRAGKWRFLVFGYRLED